VNARCPTCGYTELNAGLLCPVCGSSFAPRPVRPNSRRDRVAPLPAGAYPVYPTPVDLGGYRNPPKRSRVRTTLAVLGVVLVMVLFAAAGLVYADRRSHKSSFPGAWDPRVASIAQFVERERGLTFKHPVTVEFLTSDQYHDAVVGGDDIDEAGQDAGTGTGATMSDDEAVGQFRAVGFLSGQVDLQAAGNTLADSGTLAFYSPRDKRVRIRSTEMTPRQRVTVAHELTHALQDQYFDLGGDKLDTQSTLRPIVEGDATRVEMAYGSKVLTDAERDDKAREEAAERDQYKGQVASSNVPGVMLTAFELPYALGPQFVQIAYEQGGNEAVNALIRHPPSSDVPLLDPLRADVTTVAVSADRPLLPAGAKTLDRSPMGAGVLFLLMGERLEPAAAFDAAVSWIGEASVTSRQHGQICVDSNIRTNSKGGGALLAAMTVWAAAMPEQADVTVEGDDEGVRIHGCDPGADVAFTVPARTEQTLKYAAIRSEIELELLRDAHMTSARSECVADRSSRTMSAADLADDGYVATADSEVVAALQLAALTC
jgi:hypothetical protein